MPLRSPSPRPNTTSSGQRVAQAPDNPTGSRNFLKTYFTWRRIDSVEGVGRPKEAEEDRDLWKKRAMLSPKAKTLAKSFLHTASYFSCENQQQLTPTPICKENKNNTAIGSCSLCFKEQSGVTRWCKCGKEECKEWAHAQCLAKRKNNVSSSVSHPGTPPPPLPLILCSGIH